MSAENWCDCPQCRAMDELREDYEIYIEAGMVTVHYGCRCMACGFSSTFRHDHKLPLPQPDEECEE